MLFGSRLPYRKVLRDLALWSIGSARDSSVLCSLRATSSGRPKSTATFLPHSAATSSSSTNFTSLFESKSPARSPLLTFPIVDRPSNRALALADDLRQLIHLPDGSQAIEVRPKTIVFRPAVLDPLHLLEAELAPVNVLGGIAQSVVDSSGRRACAESVLDVEERLNEAISTRSALEENEEGVVGRQTEMVDLGARVDERQIRDDGCW